MSVAFSWSRQLRKLSFLPLFFVILAAVFAGAVWLRVRDVKIDQATTTQIAQNADSPIAPVNEAPVRSDRGAELMPAEDEGVIVETSSTPATSAVSRREQRYRELLNAPVPTSTGAAQSNQQTVTEAEAPSLIDRVVRPIADALGMKRAPPPPPLSGSAGRRAQSGSQAATEELPKDEGLPGERPAEDRPQQDEDADTTAPRLLAAEFVPNQLADGEQTVLTITASDDRSGVRNVSGVIVSPSGGQQGFACQREGETQRFSTRITVPKEAAEGVWSVKYLTITDNASNPAHFNQGQGALPPTARFTVASSASDSKGPVLKQIWLDQPSMSAGDKNFVNVQVDDDKSGVNLVSGIFLSPSKQARIGFGCRYVSGNQWQCPITPATCVDCGAWQLEQVQMQDKANNMTTLRTDHELVAPVRLQLFGDGCDSSPPQLVSIVLDPTTVQNGVQSVVKITIVASDDQCGVASLSGRASPPPNAASQSVNFPLRPSGDGQTFIGEISVHPNAANGVWSINWVQALDKGHNQKTYTAADPVLARATFTVQ